LLSSEAVRAAKLKESSLAMPRQSQTDSSVSWKDAPTKSVDVDGTKFVYRQLGPNTGVPVIFLNHAGELDRWDPRVVDGIAEKCPVIAFDNRGIGALEGSTPHSVAAQQV
jgi:hypothetical protein